MRAHEAGVSRCVSPENAARREEAATENRLSSLPPAVGQRRRREEHGWACPIVDGMVFLLCCSSCSVGPPVMTAQSIVVRAGLQVGMAIPGDTSKAAAVGRDCT